MFGFKKQERFFSALMNKFVPFFGLTSRTVERLGGRVSRVSMLDGRSSVQNGGH